MHWPIFASTFTLIFLAELPDKTAFATLLLATRGRPLAIFLGVAFAFLVQCVVAVGLGSWIGHLPQRWVHLAAGFLFLAFAAHAWWHHDEEEAEAEANTPAIPERLLFFRSAWKAFLVIFVAEWGDLTQLATASFAAKYHEDVLSVFLGAVLALWAVSAIAVLVGRRLGHALHVKALKYLGAGAFALVGLYFLYTWFRP